MDVLEVVGKFSKYSIDASDLPAAKLVDCGVRKGAWREAKGGANEDAANISSRANSWSNDLESRSESKLLFCEGILAGWIALCWLREFSRDGFAKLMGEI